MKLVRLVLVSAAPPLAWSLVLGCGSGGGYRGAFTESGVGGAQSAGTGGAQNAGAAGGGTGGFGAEGGLAAGSGGMAGQAGAAGTDAGFAGMGGFSGAASMGGFAGDGTSGVAGSAGSGGLGTTSGAGGSAATAGVGAGGTAGVGVSGASSGGTAGSSGPTRTCGERCNADADCRVFSLDQGHRCNTSTHRCERFAEPCRSSVECIADASAWVFSCTSDANCFFFSDDVCVDVGGVGRCARFAPSNGCTYTTPDAITLPRFGASGNALVCANSSRACAEGKCVPGCTTSAECTPERNGSVCDTGARLCRCVRDEDCGGAGVSHCNTATGRCECSTDEECAGLPNANVCAAGRCGCSAVTTCNAERAFTGTTYVCE